MESTEDEDTEHHGHTEVHFHEHTPAFAEGSLMEAAKLGYESAVRTMLDKATITPCLPCYICFFVSLSAMSFAFPLPQYN